MEKLSRFLLGIMVGMTVVFVLSIILPSCGNTGYGCKGKSKTKTGYKEEKFRGY